MAIAPAVVAATAETRVSRLATCEQSRGRSRLGVHLDPSPEGFE
jgi:hypothetical protein